MTDSDAVPPSTISQTLPSPNELRRRIELGSSEARLIAAARARVASRLERSEGPFLAIVGPCSIHDRTAALDYADKLRALQAELGDSVLLVMRAYFEKPRTTLGWKGYLYDPHLDGSDDLETGLVAARGLLVDLARLGVPTATELLDPLVAPYLSDTLSWAAIGARTTESQIHRQLASGLPFAVGFKNGTDGSLEAALNAVVAANAPHSMVGVDGDGRLAITKTRGNSSAHVVLRGGRSGTNYDAASVRATALAMRKAGLAPSIIVDCSHGNSEKDPQRQPLVARAVIDQMAAASEGLAGLMLESHLVCGSQSVEKRPLTYGQSVTDGCIDFATTADVLRELAERVQGPRVRVSFVGERGVGTELSGVSSHPGREETRAASALA